VQNGKKINAGLNALQFYADFALPLKNVYCWNNTLPNSLSAFMAGKVGFYFGYNYELDQIRSQSRVNFGIAPIPQIPGNPARNYADYWLEVVSKKSKHPDEAWDFILFMNKPEEVKKYLAKTNRPTAQKALTADQANIEDLRVSSQQLLTAATWYHGQDIAAAQQAFKEMAEQFLLATDQSSISNVLGIAARKVAQSISGTGQ
jgi:ABC-type glycerol-3-phosphate transport system substrate-binding protein